MKLIIQIPCHNEAETLGITLRELPRAVEGFDAVEWLIIDDGCTDKTVEIARAHGVDHVFRLTRNQGLARGFMAGLEACLKLNWQLTEDHRKRSPFWAGISIFKAKSF